MQRIAEHAERAALPDAEGVFLYGGPEHAAVHGLGRRGGRIHRKVQVDAGGHAPFRVHVERPGCVFPAGEQAAAVIGPRGGQAVVEAAPAFGGFFGDAFENTMNSAQSVISAAKGGGGNGSFGGGGGFSMGGGGGFGGMGGGFSR